jgi:hypothetical protein
MGGLGSTRWGMYRKRLCVEQCLVLDVRQLQATAAQTVTISSMDPTTETSVVYTVEVVTQVGANGGRHRQLRCPLMRDGAPCRRHCLRLFLPPGQIYLGCRACYALTYTCCQKSHADDRLATSMGMTPRQLQQFLDGSR